MSRSYAPLLCLALLPFASACKKDPEPTPPPAADTSGGETNDPNGQRMVSMRSDRETDRTCELRTVYFEFDSAELSDTARSTLAAAAQCFQESGAPSNLHLTGATDPRGTEEYNLALGERRAQAVSGYLVSLGVPASALSTSSVGEEMATGEDEAGFARDRNVDATRN